jgi:hypothetical protein
MKRIVLLVSVLLTSLVSAAWAQTFTGNVTTEDVAQNVIRQEAPCGTGCLCSPAGLKGWWAGDENANDIQGAGIPCLKSQHVPSNGILMNGATFARGFVRDAFSLDGIDDYVNVPDTPVLHTVTTAVTVEAWINPELPPDGAGWIFARRDPLVSEGISLGINVDGYLTTTFQTDVISDLASSVPVIQYDGHWKHVAVTADTNSGQVYLYLNGEPVALQVVDGSPTVSGQFAGVSHLFIGQRQGSDTPEGVAAALRYKGLIDEIGLYNRALTPGEIRAIYSVGRKGRCKMLFEPGPLGGRDDFR